MLYIMSCQSSTRTIIQPANPTTFTLTSNSCDFVVSETGNTRINLPIPTTQNYPITILNLSATATEIHDNLGNLLTTLAANAFATFLGNYLSGVWTIVGSGGTGNLSAWNINGNNLATASTIGSTNPQNVSLVYNSVPYLGLTNTGVVFNTSVNFQNEIVTGISNPSAPTDASNKQYVDTEVTNSATTIVTNANNTYSKGGALLQGTTINLTSGNYERVLGLNYAASPGSFGPGADGHTVWGYNGDYHDPQFWGPATATGGFVRLGMPNNAMWRIDGIAIGIRGNSPNLVSFTIQDMAANIIFSSGTINQTESTTFQYNFPLSLPTNIIQVNTTFATAAGSGLSYIQLYGSSS